MCGCEDSAAWSVSIVNHVPRHPARHGCVERAGHADRRGLAASERAFHSSADARNAEVVADDRNAGLADAADDGFDVFQLLALARPIEQDVVPMGWIEVFDGFQLETGRVHFAPKRGQLIE